MGSKTLTKKWSVQPLLAAGVVFVLYQLATIATGTNPFTGGSLLAGDYSDQYLGMFNYLHLVAAGQASAAYSFGNGLGGGMMGNWAYYLLSPFNLIALPFSAARMPFALFLITSFKLACMGASFAWFANRRWPELNGDLRLALSVAYGLMGYALTYQREFMWLDALVFLPLIVAALGKVLRRESVLPYTIWLGITLIANYYTGFMVCIFLALFTCYAVIGEGTWRDAGELLRAVWRVIWSSLLAVLLAAVVLVPTFMNLMSGKMGVDTGTPVLARSPLVLATRLLIGAVDDHIARHPGVLSVPTIYVGGLALMFAVLYFAATGIARRTRITAGVVSIIWAALSLSTRGYLLLHGGANPVGYPYRYAFLLSFWLLYLAGSALLALQKGQLNRKWVWGLMGLAVLGTAVLLLKHHELNATVWRVGLTGVLWVLPLVVLAVGARRWHFAARIVLIATVLEMGGNALLITAQTRDTQSVKSYQAYNLEMQQLTLAMRQDAGISAQPERADKNFMRHIDRGDGMVYGYGGASIFSSNLAAGTPELMRLLGQRTAGYYVQYSNGTALTDAMLGMRYQMTSTRRDKSKNSAIRVYGSRDDLRGTVLAHVGQEQLYKLKQAPVALAFTPANQTEPKLAAGDSLRNQERVLQAWSGSTARLLTSTPLTVQGTASARVQADGAIRANGKATTVSWTLPRTKGQVYLSVPPVYYTKPNKLYLNGKRISIFPGYPVTVPLGVNATQHAAVLTVKLKKTTGSLPAVTASVVNAPALAKMVRKINRGALRFTRATPGHLTAHVTTARASSAVMTTIPAERGWRVQVDGKTVGTGSALKGVFMTFTVAGKGKHTVVMRYRTPGLLVGTVVSLLALCTLLLIFFFQKKTRGAKRRFLV